MRRSAITMSYVLVSIAAGLTVPRLEYHYLPQWAHGVSVSSAQALLSAAASGMMAFTGIAFSLGFVIVQFSGAAYSPRLTSWFARDPLLFHALGVFAATFVYALATLGWIDRDRDGYVPFFSTYVVIALLFASLSLLVALIVKIGALGIANVLQLVGQAGRTVIQGRFPELDAKPANDRLARNVVDVRAQRPTQIVRYRGEPKAVADIDLDLLTRVAADANAVISASCSIGDTLGDGMEVFAVYGSDAPVSERRILRALDLRRERSVEHDPKYALRILVDIAIKALSPAVNDPTTAVQSLDQIEDLLSRLARRELDGGAGRDERGILRAVYPCATWEDYLALAFDEIRVCGSSQMQVMRRLRAALHDLEAVCPGGSRADAVRAYLRRLDATVERSELDAADRAYAGRDDRQGIGVTR